MSTILAIESSCDETSVAIIQQGKITANVVANQTIHEKFGGVVPELASRVHQQHIIPTVTAALSLAGITRQSIDAVAFTQGPGLLGSLLVGVSFAKAFALALGKPLIAINHMQAHILAHFIDSPQPPFPFLCLTVSGGHTQIVLVKDYFDMEIVGETIDDAAGEAFDKTAKILNLPYPGGPLIDKYAQLGDATRFKFPIPKIPHLDFSFSGFKTAVLYFVKEQWAQNPQFIEENLNDICASVQDSIVQILMLKLKQAVEKFQITHIAIAGGVSANSGLRNALLAMEAKGEWKVYIPKFEYCTDNAAMIAMAAHFKFQKQDFENQYVAPLPRWHFGT